MSESTTISSSGGARSGVDVEVLRNFIDGRWVPSSAAEHLDVHNPARGDVIARTPLSTAADVDAAVAAAAEAYPGLARDAAGRPRAGDVPLQAPAGRRTSRTSLATVTTEHGKTLDESRGSVRRGIENVEVACGAPSLLMGYGARGHRVGHRLHRDAPAARRLRGDRAVQLPGDGAALVPAVRGRERQHVRRQAVRAGAALAAAHVRAARTNATCRRAS